MKRIACCLPLYFVWVLSLYPQGIQKEHCVINIQGASVYQAPNFRAPKVKILVAGEAVFPEAILDMKDTCSTPGGLRLVGNWAKLLNGEGFVFTTDLTDKSVETGETNYGEIFIDFMGEFVSEKMDTVMQKTPNGEFPQLIITSRYTQGTYVYAAFDGCFDHTYEYQHLSFHEVYHQLASHYQESPGSNRPRLPVFAGEKGGIFRFTHDGASQDIQFEQKPGGSWVISSYDCT